MKKISNDVGDTGLLDRGKLDIDVTNVSDQLNAVLGRVLIVRGKVTARAGHIYVLMPSTASAEEMLLEHATKRIIGQHVIIKNLTSVWLAVTPTGGGTIDNGQDVFNIATGQSAAFLVAGENMWIRVIG